MRACSQIWYVDLTAFRISPANPKYAGHAAPRRPDPDWREGRIFLAALRTRQLTSHLSRVLPSREVSVNGSPFAVHFTTTRTSSCLTTLSPLCVPSEHHCQTDR